ncbi:hypothetical protein BDN72DRAFT_832624 [Pluteus cervinus]|uniref:Uncharacterized protein n=1 Tax=Pluteus cervinus TaxID=181527 RepID=A0ACD3BB83_9AGAR|nr:hypothetical protein BDN72DRAFT_832624 [Pluteus cervinus]
MSSESWPPQLKDWVARCLGQMTETNKVEASEEMKKVIAEAYSAGTLWTTDWAVIQLQSLLPKPVLNINLKRKTTESSPVSKKAKKTANKQAARTSSDSFSDQLALNRRAERFQREHEIEKSKVTRNHFPKSLHHTAHLFNDRTSSRSGSPLGIPDDPEADPNVMDWDRHTIVGTSQAIFKDYLRLTSEPKPETIRPYSVLQKTLQELKQRWRAKHPYPWVCSQFKSLRQDLTVQRIKNDFTVQVYEIHARMALESNDMVEYNQCQATLKTLYDLGIPGKVEEFTAYRILMLLHGRNRSELNLFVGQLTPNQKKDPAVSHALAVSRAIAMGNYHLLFDLYLDAPNMSAYIMDHFIDRERARALLIITKAYKTIPLAYLNNKLGFDDLDAARQFLVDHSIAFFVDPQQPDNLKNIDCKPAMAKLTQVLEEKYRKVSIRGAI